MVGLAACAESFGAVCMLCAEKLTILPIGCIIGQKNLFAKSPVPHRCSWLASSLRTEKKCTAIYRNLPQYTAILPQFFLGLGDRNPPPPQVEGNIARCTPCILYTTKCSFVQTAPVHIVHSAHRTASPTTQHSAHPCSTQCALCTVHNAHCMLHTAQAAQFEHCRQR